MIHAAISIVRNSGVIQALGLTLTGMVLARRVPEYLRHDAGSQRDARTGTVDPPGDRRQPARWSRHLLSRSRIVWRPSGGTLASLVLVQSSVAGFLAHRQPVPPQLQEALKVDLPMVAFCFGLCLLTSLVFGLLPAIRFSRPVILSALKDDAGGGGLRVGRVHRVTAALQVAIAVPLLVMSGIVARSRPRHRNLRSRIRVRPAVRRAVEARRRLRLIMPNAGFPNPKRPGQSRQGERCCGRNCSGRPSARLPRSPQRPCRLQTEANVAPKFVRVHVTRVGDDYLNTMGIPLLRGRDFSGDDGAGAEMVTIISKPLAERLFPDAEAAEAIGKRLMFGPADEDKTRTTLTIVGVTGDFPTSQMSTEREQLLLPLAQHPTSRNPCR